MTTSSEQPVELTTRPRPDATASPPDTRRGVLRSARDTAALAWDAQVTRRHPISVVHFVTRRCNARCSFCFVDFDSPMGRSLEMTVPEIERLTRSFGPRLTNVNITGGEPFLRRDLPEIVDLYYRLAGVRSVYVTSNGYFTKRTVELADLVRQRHPDRLLMVSISIDATPERHDAIRRVDGLFARAMSTYHALEAAGPTTMANIAITVSHENHEQIPELYQLLVGQLGVRSVTAVAVRDEGVHRVGERQGIATAYRWLTQRIVDDHRSGVLRGYDPGTLQGRVMNRKNEILWDLVASTYQEPRYVSPCRAASLFAVIDADAGVHPCEVLDRPLGNLRDHDMDFGSLWSSPAAVEARRWIVESKCHCSYECALGFNILGNARYQPALLRAALRR